ncbi:MAG: nicotinate (nicotinamide) nucleotide adenylyltransferase [Firmicutes bacterium]|nr:nicotinate (nicotinamide) nucleotide adenylyltransferase [Bacillota bacterium]
MKIGIFGGTFDPPHIEHLNICLNCKKELNLDKTLVIPAGEPPHKLIKKTDKKMRFEMAKIAFSGLDFVKVSDIEINEQVSYTYKTLEKLKTIYKDDEFYLIIGSDSFNDFETWKNTQSIVKSSKIVVVNRENSKVIKELKENFINKYNTQPKILNFCGRDISSKVLRAFLEFKIFSDTMDKSVFDYIVKNNLYSGHKDFIEQLKLFLTEKRFIHTAFTVLEAVKLSYFLNSDPTKAFIAAALHDIAKKYSETELKERFNYTGKEKYPPKVAHAFAGRHIAKTVFKISDPDILNGIEYHTTARPNMSLLEKIIYVADCIEKTRDYLGLEKLREMVYNNFEEGFRECVRQMYELINQKPDYEVCDYTEKAYAYYTQNKGVINEEY